MTETSAPLTFVERLQQQDAQNQTAIKDSRLRIQDLMKEELRELGETSRQLSAAELRQTESAIRNDHRRAARRLAALWLRTTVVGLAVFAAIWSSVWVIGQWQHRQIKENIDLLLLIDQQIEERRQTLRELNQE